MGEDEEEVDLCIVCACVEDLARLGKIESRILKRVKEEFGVGEEMGFVCLGGFENKREVFDWKDLKLEVDETKYEFGICYEVECESEDPDGVKKLLEEFLKENGISYSYSKMTKFAVFRSGSCLGKVCLRLISCLDGFKICCLKSLFFVFYKSCLFGSFKWFLK